jgi:hypothetical protein
VTDPALVDEYDPVDEYNAFGPWVSRVERSAEVPPLFASQPIDFASSSPVLKFPRAESRRDLEPGMNLYDHLLQLTPDGLIIVERRGTAVERSEVPFAALAAISSGTTLLDGRLTMHLLDGRSYSIAFNGSSSGVITGLVDTVRDRVRGLSAGQDRWHPVATETVRMPLGMDDLGSADAGLTAAANDLVGREEALRVLSTEGRRKVITQGGRMDRWRDLISPMVLHGSVIAAAETELVVLSRVEWMSRSKAPEVSMKRTIIMLDRVSSITAAALERYPEVTAVTVRSGRSSLDLLFPAGSRGIAALTRS